MEPESWGTKRFVSASTVVLLDFPQTVLCTGSRKSHNSNMLADDASRKKQSHLKPAVMPEEDDEEDEEEMPRKRTRPRSSRLTPRSKFLDEGVESDQESADDLMVNTLVSGLVPRVEELLKGDDPDDVMPMQGEEEDEGQADDEDHPEREDDFGRERGHTQELFDSDMHSVQPEWLALPLEPDCLCYAMFCSLLIKSQVRRLGCLYRKHLLLAIEI